jgi:hypothetical protein
MIVNVTHSSLILMQAFELYVCKITVNLMCVVESYRAYFCHGNANFKANKLKLQNIGRNYIYVIKEC